MRTAIVIIIIELKWLDPNSEEFLSVSLRSACVQRIVNTAVTLLDLDEPLLSP